MIGSPKGRAYENCAGPVAIPGQLWYTESKHHGRASRPEEEKEKDNEYRKE